MIFHVPVNRGPRLYERARKVARIKKKIKRDVHNY